MLPFLVNENSRRTRAPPIIRFISALSFLATGSYQKPVGADRVVSSAQSAVSRHLHEVVDIIVNHLAHNYIRFPQNAIDMADVKQGYVPIGSVYKTRTQSLLYFLTI